MKILALIGSPRRGSNTDILVDQILKGTEESRRSIEKLYLYDFDISACIDCRKCKRPDYTCAIRDGMAQILPKFEEADLIIFGTPLYWYGPTAKMKLLIDRLRPFIASGRLKGKRGIVVIPSEEGGSRCGPLVEMFQMTFQYLGMHFAGCVLARGYEKKDVLNHPEELVKAYELGRSIRVQVPNSGFRVSNGVSTDNPD